MVLAPRARSWLAIGLVLAAAGALFLIRPDSEQINLREGDEIWFLEVALEMAQGRDSWLWPNTADAGMDKPPGFLALIATSFAALGPSVHAGRLPSALMVILAALGVALAGRRVGGPLTAALAGLTLLVPPMLYLPRSGLAAVTEPALVATMAAVLALSVAIAGDAARVRTRGMALGAVLGAMTLLKTAIVILPVACLAASVGLVGAPARGRLLRAAPWAASALVLTGAVWPIASLVAGRGDYLAGVWLAGGLAKIGEVVGGGSREPGYLLKYTASGLGPLLPTAGLACLASLVPGDPATRPARRLALCFVLGTVGLFSITATQWPWYSVPAFPALALLVGVVAVGAAGRPSPWLPALLAAAVAFGLLLHQPWVQAFDALHPEVGMLEIPFQPRPAHLLTRHPVWGAALGGALPVAVGLGWGRLGPAARGAVTAALLGSLVLTSAANVVRMLWFPEVRPDPPLLTMVDLALAKEARGGAEDHGLNGGYLRLHLAMLEAARPREPRTIRVRASDPGHDEGLVLERARPVQLFEERSDFPGEPMTRRGGAWETTLQVPLGPDEPLMLRLRRGDDGRGRLEAPDCLRLLTLPAAGEVTLDLTYGQLVPQSLPPGVGASVFCGAARPHFRGRATPRD